MSKKTVNSTDSNSPKIEGVGITHGINGQELIGNVRKLLNGRRHTHFLIYGAVISLMIIAALMYLAVPGVKTIVQKGLNFASVAVNGSCEGDKLLIADYNSSVQQNGLSKLQPLVDRIKEKRNYSSDATCMYILTGANYGNLSASELSDAYKTLIKLDKEGKKPSAEIKDGVDRAAMFRLIEAIIDDQRRGVTGPKYGQG